MPIENFQNLLFQKEIIQCRFGKEGILPLWSWANRLQLKTLHFSDLATPLFVVVKHFWNWSFCYISSEDDYTKDVVSEGDIKWTAFIRRNNWYKYAVNLRDALTLGGA